MSDRGSLICLYRDDLFFGELKREDARYEVVERGRELTEKEKREGVTDLEGGVTKWPLNAGLSL